MKSAVIRKTVLTVLISLLVLWPGYAAHAGSDAGGPAGKTAVQPAAAGVVSGKEENIYAVLNGDGSVAGIYVVNCLDITREGRVEDYGNYTAVKNLTSLESIQCENGAAAVLAQAGKFYYQGDLASPDLPWTVSIQYSLDGRAIGAADLAGRNGRLSILIETARNNAVDPVFFDYYMLQVSVTLDEQRCRDVSADGAVLASAGKNKIVTYTVMPGSAGSLAITADVSDFEMEGITLSALPFTINIGEPDISEMEEQMVQLSDAIAGISDGAAQLHDGISNLSDGAGKLKKGSSGIKDGLSAISGQSASLLGASAAVHDALGTVSASLAANPALGGLAALSELPSALSQFASVISGLAQNLSELGAGFEAAFNALDQAMAAIPDPVPPSDLQALAAKNAGDKTFEQLLAAYQASQVVKGTYQQTRPAFTAVQNSLGPAAGALETISSGLSTLQANLADALASDDIGSALAELSAGLSAISANYGAFHQGLAAYFSAVGQLSAQYGEFNNGLRELSAGLSETVSGAAGLSDGTASLNDETNDLPEQLEKTVRDMIDQYRRSDFSPVSFVSPLNNNVARVQFILTTPAIRMPEHKADIPEPQVKSVWEKLLALFQ